jgi:hypothetical protein
MILYKTILIEGRKHRWTSTFCRTPYWTLRVAQINTTKYKKLIRDIDRNKRVIVMGGTEKMKCKVDIKFPLFDRIFI